MQQNTLGGVFNNNSPEPVETGTLFSEVTGGHTIEARETDFLGGRLTCTLVGYLYATQGRQVDAERPGGVALMIRARQTLVTSMKVCVPNEN